MSIVLLIFLSSGKDATRTSPPLAFPGGLVDL